MTTNLEKQFFSTFGIKPKPLFSTRNGYTDNAYLYPQITDRILLELMYLIGQQRFGFLYCENTFSTGLGNPKDLVMVQAENFKEGILTLAIQKKTVLRIKKDVQALFKEEL